jgi:hypothetical protein
MSVWGLCNAPPGIPCGRHRAERVPWEIGGHLQATAAGCACKRPAPSSAARRGREEAPPGHPVAAAGRSAGHRSIPAATRSVPPRTAQRNGHASRGTTWGRGRCSARQTMRGRRPGGAGETGTGGRAQSIPRTAHAKGRRPRVRAAGPDTKSHPAPVSLPRGPRIARRYRMLRPGHEGGRRRAERGVR